ncbi:VOC family protein [Arthrobacter sp. VKM Ac-2550]|uniref:2-oxoadipate dioxygenase/decarboxylase n=1 Tax=Crystallibacter permensis TaxID=1938888 RepID=UPI002226C49D|nr:VOC family protein [Arthrobacter sp. VKM Ac-2550]MCW2130864.1 putative metalloenzyme YdcJ, glyoxalase superfamily [Arthrobacter sp. VKM Ac-2550]
MSFKSQWEMRAAFAQSLSTMYGTEVPAYNTLVEVSTEVNQEHLRRHGADAERLGSIGRVTAERHGAIRVGSDREMSQVARVFAAFGMHPVGFYDLRDAASSAVPVVSTAFRPIDADQLAKNPFRVFTSMLAVEDQRFFDGALQRELADFFAHRELFVPELLELADRAAAGGGLPETEADRLLELATGAFELSAEPVDHDWYRRLEAISAVASDIGGVASTHINHLTPRVLDIDALYSGMEDRGITMIDEIQGPPRWDGPDVLLRQTSFKALGEKRLFRHADGSVQPGELRVRFGEVEARGIALTPAGRDVYDRMVAEVDSRLATDPDLVRQDVAKGVWEEHLPRTEAELAARGLAYFTFAPRPEALPEAPSGPITLAELIASGAAVPEPVVYEDFLPRSAAGIFQSNLTDEGSKNDAEQAAAYDIDRMSRIVGREVLDPNGLYQAQQDASVVELAKALQIEIAPASSAAIHTR